MSANRKLPPLTSLRAFEAAARLTGFNAAADELNVTPSAISHQIKSLEQWLGAALFVRKTRQIELTRTARDLLPSVTAALDQLADSCRRASASKENPTLTISVAHTFANGWLVPHLPSFQMAFPEIEVRLTLASSQLEQHFAIPEVDVAIAHGMQQARDGVVADWLMNEDLIPVCCPSLVAPEGPLATPADIGKVTLLQVVPRMGQWRTWLEAAGVHDVPAERGPRFQSTPIALEAALAGAGIAIANRRFVAPHLESGRLVLPFDVDMPGASEYFLLYPLARRDDHVIRAFRSWLLNLMIEEANEDEAHAHPVAPSAPLSAT